MSTKSNGNIKWLIGVGLPVIGLFAGGAIWIGDLHSDVGHNTTTIEKKVDKDVYHNQVLTLQADVVEIKTKAEDDRKIKNEFNLKLMEKLGEISNGIKNNRWSIQKLSK